MTLKHNSPSWALLQKLRNLNMPFAKPMDLHHSCVVLWQSHSKSEIVRGREIAAAKISGFLVPLQMLLSRMRSPIELGPQECLTRCNVPAAPSISPSSSSPLARFQELLSEPTIIIHMLESGWQDIMCFTKFVLVLEWPYTCLQVSFLWPCRGVSKCLPVRAFTSALLSDRAR